jgi:ribonuclease HI
LPSGVQANVYSDNQSLVENCRRHLDGWRSSGFAKVDPSIVEIVKRIDSLVVTKALSITWQWVRSHGDNAGNNRADELAAQGAREAKAELKAAERARSKKPAQ